MKQESLSTGSKTGSVSVPNRQSDLDHLPKSLNLLGKECRGRESNPHAACATQDFKSCASASFATPASERYHTNQHDCTEVDRAIIEVVPTIASITTSLGGVPKTSVFEAFHSDEGVSGDAHADTSHHGGPDRAVVLYSDRKSVV